MTANSNRIFTNPTNNQTISEVSPPLGLADGTLKHVQVSLKEWCSGSNNECASGSVLKLKLTGASNPSSTRAPKESFKINIYTQDGYFTD